VLVYEPAAHVLLDGLEDELARAFGCMKSALAAGESVVVLLDDRDLQGVREPAQAALAHGLLGLARAFAIEGSKAGWRTAVLSSTPDVEPAERQRWIDRLGEPGAAKGALVRLGGEHLGRVPA
jgi:hypothetical protein